LFCAGVVLGILVLLVGWVDMNALSHRVGTLGQDCPGRPCSVAAGFH
jgi:hypothetical protein